jgi:hypothetical protein
VTRPVRRLLGALASAALVVGATVAAAPALAQPATQCRHLTLPQQIRRSDVVFRGVVEKVRAVHGRGTQRLGTYQVKADRVYRSSLVADRVVVTVRVGAACPPPTLVKGKRYIFFVTERGPRLVSTSATARATKKLTDHVVARLGSGAQPHPPPPPKATFTKVADASPPTLSRVLAPGVALIVLSLLGLVVLGRRARAA